MRWKYIFGVIKWLALLFVAIVALLLSLDYMDMCTEKEKLRVELEKQYIGYAISDSESQLGYYHYFRRGYLEWTLLDYRVVFTHSGKKYMGYIEKSGSWTFEEYSKKSIDAYYSQYKNRIAPNKSIYRSTCLGLSRRPLR